MKTSIHDQLLERMAAYRGLHNQIAKDTGISQSTVSRVARGEVSPTLAVAQPIFDWMDRYEAITKRIKAVVAESPPIRQKAKKGNANGRGLRNLKPASAVHG